MHFSRRTNMGGTAEIDVTKLDEFIGKAVTDLGATFNAGLVVRPRQRARK
jgi:hypothetical protein